MRILCILLLFSIGCTTPIAINSNPSNATVIVDGEMIGQTPIQADISVFAKSFRVRVEKSGYAPQERIVQKRVANTSTWGNAYAQNNYGGSAYATGNQYSTTEEWPDVFFRLEKE